MATKVTILGQEQNQTKELKKIEFVHIVDDGINCAKLRDEVISPYKWQNIELVSKGGKGYYDIMFAYDNDRNRGRIYLGHFNDGIV